jgi:hypothetical protein
MQNSEILETRSVEISFAEGLITVIQSCAIQLIIAMAQEHKKSEIGIGSMLMC